MTSKKITHILWSHCDITVLFVPTPPTPPPSLQERERPSRSYPETEFFGKTVKWPRATQPGYITSCVRISFWVISDAVEHSVLSPNKCLAVKSIMSWTFLTDLYARSMASFSASDESDIFYLRYLNILTLLILVALIHVFSISRILEKICDKQIRWLKLTEIYWLPPYWIYLKSREITRDFIGKFAGKTKKENQLSKPPNQHVIERYYSDKSQSPMV